MKLVKSNKVYELAAKIKSGCEGVIKDCLKGDAPIDFAKGVAIESEIILNDLEEIWNCDLSNYKTNYDVLYRTDLMRGMK